MISAEEIIKKLQNNNYEAYIVGGAVRDMLLGIKPKDKDIVTSAQPEEVMSIFKKHNIKSIGVSFKIVFVDGIEVATFRTDKYKGLNDKSVEIYSAMTLEEDTKRRDFTINSMAYDPFTKKLYDYVNGQEDLKNKLVRFVGEPKRRIWEDPNRIIRACRFTASIGGELEENTFNELKKYSDLVEYISLERIRLEIMKAMKIKKASRFFYDLHDIKALKYIFPTLNNCYMLDGGPYHIEPVFDHCMMSGDHISTKFPLLKLSSYLHDVGKYISCRINPRTDNIWFEGHEKDGAKVLKEELANLKFSNDEIHYISNLVSLHMRISYERISPKSVRRTLKKLNDFNIGYRDLLRIAISDKMGNIKSRKNYTFNEIKQLFKCFKDEVERENPVNCYANLKLNGKDIMRITGISPGKEVGKILKYLMDSVIEEPEQNNKEDLTKLALDFYHEGNKKL